MNQAVINTNPRKKKNKAFRYMLIITLALLTLMIAGKKAGWFGKESSFDVSTEKAEKRTIIETITANGKIQPETEVKLSPDVSGEIVELYVADGDEVKKGVLLLKIKPEIYQSNIERMEAALNSAKAQLAQAEAQLIERKSNFNRMEKLWESKTISESEFESASSALEIAEANVSAAKYSIMSSEASLKEAKENLSKTIIYSPIDGTISKLNVEQGERVVGTVQMAGTELLRIANLELMEVKVDVNENDIIRVSIGDTAIIEVDAYIDEKFKGIVTEIANSATSTGIATDQVTNFEVKIRVLPQSYRHLVEKEGKNKYPLRPGMSATVDIRTHTAENVLSIPIEAVTTRRDSSEKGKYPLADSGEENNDENIDEVVFIYNNDGSVKQTKVKTGVQDDRYIEILDGISPEDEVVCAPYSAISKRLKDGMKVVKVPREKLFEGKE